MSSNKGMSKPIILTIVMLLVILVVGGLLFYSKYLASPEKNEDCKKTLNEIKDNNPEELITLYENLERPQLWETGCDYGPEKVRRECLKGVQVLKYKLSCMQSFLDNNPNVTKENLLEVEEF